MIKAKFPVISLFLGGLQEHYSEHCLICKRHIQSICFESDFIELTKLLENIGNGNTLKNAVQFYTHEQGQCAMSQINPKWLNELLLLH